MTKKLSAIWPEGKGCAVSLTYDDAFESHWREVAPALEERGFRGTFYTPIRPSLWNHAEQWRKVAQAGHELGNHTVFHPCRRPPESENYKGFDRFDLSRYTLEEFEREVAVANAYLQLLDGQPWRTYGHTCYDMTVGRGSDEVSVTPVVRKHFSAARGARRLEFAASAIDGINLFEIGAVSSYHFEDFKRGIDHARESQGWLIIALHDVAEREERLRIARTEHEALLDYLATDDSIWLNSVRDVAAWIAPRSDEDPKRDISL